MLPPTLRYGSVPLIRRFCNVPGDTPSSLRTSALFSHSLSKLSFALLPMICLNSSSISRLNCRRSSRVMMSISISLSLYFHIRISRYRAIDSRRLHGARYTAKYTDTLRWGCASVLGYPRRIPETPMAIAWGKQVGLCPTSACSIPIGEWQFGGTCEQHGLAPRPNGVISGVPIGRHPLRWDKVGG